MTVGRTFRTQCLLQARALWFDTDQNQYRILRMYDLRFLRRWLWRIAPSGMLRRVALVRTDVTEELSTSFFRVTRIGELGTTVAVTSNRLVTASVLSSSPILVTTMKEALSSSETSVLARATWRNVTEDDTLQLFVWLEKEKRNVATVWS
jgi:hypothetical protein